MRRKRRNKGILAGVLICFLLLSGAVSGCTAREAEGEGTDPSAAVTTQEYESEMTEGVTNTEAEEMTAEGLQEEELIELSAEYARQMAEGDFETITQSFSDAMKEQLSSPELAKAWEDSVRDLGSYIGLSDTKVIYQNGYVGVTIILEYEENGLSVLFTYNQSGKLDQLWITYSAIAKPAVTECFREISIEIGDGEYPAEGILTVPNDVENPPVVILVHGSGQHDMDETIGAAGNKPFRDLAHGLAKQGIAVIRYNKRYYQYPELVSSTVTIEDEVLDDVAAAIRFAVGQENLDTDRLIVIGHSLGGMLAPKIAQDNEEVDGIVIMAGSPRRLEDIILDQNREAIQAIEDMSEEEKAELLSEVEAEAEKVRNLTDAQLEEPIFGMTGYYWKSLNEIDTAQIAKDLEIPILILQGEADYQIHADVDYVQWQGLLMGKSNVEFRLYPNLNHMFMPTGGYMTEEDYAAENQVDEQVINDIAEWIARTENRE